MRAFFVAHIVSVALWPIAAPSYAEEIGKLSSVKTHLGYQFPYLIGLFWRVDYQVYEEKAPGLGAGASDHVGPDSSVLFGSDDTDDLYLYEGWAYQILSTCGAGDVCEVAVFDGSNTIVPFELTSVDLAASTGVLVCIDLGAQHWNDLHGGRRLKIIERQRGLNFTWWCRVEDDGGGEGWLLCKYLTASEPR